MSLKQDDLALYLHQTVRCTTYDGLVHKGAVTGLTATDITVTHRFRGPVTIPITDVQSIALA